MPPAFDFWTEGRHVAAQFAGDIQSGTFMITGISGHDLGARIAIDLAAHKPKRLILVSARNDEAELEPVEEQIRAVNEDVLLSVWMCDISDLRSVRRVAWSIFHDHEITHIDVVINTEAAQLVGNYKLSEQGVEMALAANYLGRFLLVNLIFYKVVAAGDGARIINVTNRAHRLSPFRFDNNHWNFSDMGGSGEDGAVATPYDKHLAYAQSCTAVMLFTAMLEQRLRKHHNGHCHAFAIHPGTIWGTGLQSQWSLMKYVERNRPVNGKEKFEIERPKTLPMASAPILAVALDPCFDNFYPTDEQGCSVTGYFEGTTACLVTAEPHAVDIDAAGKLWTLSERLVGQRF